MSLTTTRSVARYLCSGLAAVSTLSGQAPPLSPGSTTRQVQLTVVVRGRKGRPVTDLKPGDFTLEENGERQEIRVLSRPGEHTGVRVILLDGLNSRWAGEFPQPSFGADWPVEFPQPSATVIRLVDLANARRSLVEYLLKIPPHDHVAIYTLGMDRLHVVHDPREGPAALLKALSTYLAEGTPDLASSSAKAELAEAAATVAGSPEKAWTAAEAVAGIANIVVEPHYSPGVDSQELTLNSLEAIANHLAGVSGPKNLVWVSTAGFGVLAGPVRHLRHSSRPPYYGPTGTGASKAAETVRFER